MYTLLIAVVVVLLLLVISYILVRLERNREEQKDLKTSMTSAPVHFRENYFTFL